MTNKNEISTEQRTEQRLRHSSARFQSPRLRNWCRRPVESFENYVATKYPKVDSFGNSLKRGVRQFEAEYDVIRVYDVPLKIQGLRMRQAYRKWQSDIKEDEGRAPESCNESAEKVTTADGQEDFATTGM